jgi:hypothetical protein
VIFISHHDGHVTTTAPVHTGQRFVFAVVMGFLGFVLVRCSAETHPWAWGRILIGAMMVLLACVVIFGARFRIRRSRK